MCEKLCKTSRELVRLREQLKKCCDTLTDAATTVNAMHKKVLDGAADCVDLAQDCEYVVHSIGCTLAAIEDEDQDDEH